MTQGFFRNYEERSAFVVLQWIELITKRAIHWSIQRIRFICNAIKGLWFTSQEMKILGLQIRKSQQSALSYHGFWLE
jgi:hypothetical protein